MQKQQINHKSGFTLLELLIAILLIGILGSFVFNNIGKFDKPKEVVTIANLPHILQKNLTGDGEMVCVNKCSSCYYITDSAKLNNISLPFPLKVRNEYIIDKNNNPVKIKLGRLNDKKICLRIRHYKNNSISQVILENNGEFIFIPSYFSEGKKFGSLSDATAYWIRNREKLQGRGDWY